MDQLDARPLGGLPQRRVQYGPADAATRARPERRVDPPGAVIDTFPPQHVDVPIVTSARRRLTRWPAAPVNVACMFCPGVVVESVTAPPPAAIAELASAGTS